MGAIPTSIKYQCDGNTVFWPVNFPYGSDRQVAVTLVNEDGSEKRLAPGRDYQIQNHMVICVQPAGKSLVIWLDAPVELAMGQAAARTMESGPAYVPAAAQEPENSSITTMADYEAAASREMARVADACAQSATDAEGRIATAMNQAMAAINASADAAMAKAARAAATARSPVSSEAAYVLSADVAAGAYLELPLAYVAGAGTLSIYKNGLLMAPGISYDELGIANSLEQSVRMLEALYAGDVLHVRVAAICVTEQAVRSAKQAREAQTAAAEMLANAREAQRDAARVTARSASDAGTAQAWAQCSEKSADEAHNAACAAWEAACQVSIHARRPGVSAVKCLADIPGCSPGLFIINPHLTHAPTPFMGVWPAASTDDMLWDGVFFISSCLYGEDPKLPPERPVKPVPVPSPGTGDTWLPCGHNHEPVPDCGGCCQRTGCAAAVKAAVE